MMDRLGLTREQVSELHSSMMALIAATTAEQAAADHADAGRA
jgi:hypothetical protein